jgi:hypothetical protein
MVNTSDQPITVDGVRLDTLAWNVEKVNRATAARRSADLDIPGLDGVVPSVNDPLEAGSFGLELFVRGSDVDGVGLSKTTLWNNVDTLVHLFGKRHSLVELVETVGASTRRAMAKVVDTIAPDVNDTGSVARFSVGFSIPAGCWEDTATADWTSGVIVSGTPQEVTTLQGATERNQDATLLVTGPITNPMVTDPATGAWVQLGAALTGTQFWRVNLATWSSRYGTGLGLGSADTTGTDAQDLTTYGGALGVTSFTTLTPVRTAGDPVRRTSLALSGTAGITSATRLSVRARRKYAL